MNEFIEFLANAQGQYDLGSLFKLFTAMIAIDGIIGIIYAFLKGAHGR